MADLPAKGTFKIQTIGPRKDGTNAKGNPYAIYDLQFDGDPTWYNTFWPSKEAPAVGNELKGEKSYNDKFNSYQFKIEREGGRSNWNPAGAQSTIILASVTVVNGFLSIPGNYEAWEKGAPELKAKFEKYVKTVESASTKLKELAVSMGSIQAEQPVASSQPKGTGDPGPTPPPQIEGWPEGEEPANI